LNALQRQDELRDRLDRSIQSQLKAQTFRLENAANQLTLLSPIAVLKRGYAIITDQLTGMIISHAAQVYPDQPVTLRVQDGSMSARIDPPKTGENNHA
jgi:exodeoxyribonuclease VII large subunit